MSLQGFSPAEYIESAYVISLTRSCQVAGSVLVLYDHLLTFDREVDYVWNYNLAFGSICYLIIRYIGDALAILNIIVFLVHEVETPNVGRVYFFVQSWPGILVLFLIQLVLQLRLYALYQQSKKLLAFMGFGYLCEISAMTTIMTLLGATSKGINEIMPGQYICSVVHAPAFYQLYVFWIPVIIYDGMLCLLALWVGLKDLISRFRAKRIDGIYITGVLVKGNAGYFLCILLSCILNIAIGVRFGVRWMQVSEGWPASTEALIGCRLILGLRASLARGVKEERFQELEVSHWAVAETRLSLRPLATDV